MPRLTITLTNAVKQLIENGANRNGVSQSDFANFLINNGMNQTPSSHLISIENIENINIVNNINVYDNKDDFNDFIETEYKIKNREED